MTAVGAIDHVAIATEDMNAAARLFCGALGGSFLRGGDNDETGIRLLHVRFPQFKVELMQPVRSDSLLRSYLDQHGEGFHHMTFLVDDLTVTTQRLGDAGLPVVGADLASPRWQEAFIHPRATFGALLQFVSTTLDWSGPEPGLQLQDVLDGNVVWCDYVPCLRNRTNRAD
jgi:methylmalonyl-CoA/ethylmalonyl-CoA epimerase